ncbi:MAG: TRL-like family protein [Treponema sp.]|nr:TRL-like family protein [Treponema sp.]
MKKAIFALVVLAVLLMAACSTITLPVEITDNPVGDKVGETTESYLFGYLYISGSGAYSAAAANGGVTKIATVEKRIVSNPFMTKVTTIVTGN